MIAIGQQEGKRPKGKVGSAAVIVSKIAQQRRNGIAPLAAGPVLLKHRRATVTVAYFTRTSIRINKIDINFLETAGAHFLQHVGLHAVALVVRQHKRVHASVFRMCGRTVIALLIVLY